MLLLNGLATVFAVILHSVYWVLTAMIWWTDRYQPEAVVPNFDRVGGPGYYVLFLIEPLVAMGVPAFLFISGYFVATTTGEQGRTLTWKIVVARIVNLVPPYLIWSTAAVSLQIIDGQRYSVLSLLWKLLNGGVTAPYYYVPVLIQFYLLSPFITQLARRHWKWVLAVTGLIQLVQVLLHNFFLVDPDVFGSTATWVRIIINWHLIGLAFWFALGMVVGFHVSKFKQHLALLKRPLVIALPLLLTLALIEGEALRQLSGRYWISGTANLFSGLFALTALLSFFAFDNTPIPYTARLSQIGAKSYGIYLIHVLVLEVTARMVYHVVPGLLAYQILFQPLLIVAGLGIPLVIMEIVKRSPIRRYYAYMFG